MKGEFTMEKNRLTQEIDRVVLFMSEIDPDSDDYSSAAQNLKVLCEARSKKPSFVVEPEVIVAGLVNLLGIVLIIKHEQFNVVTSRAMTFIRPK
jgi:hypothetical protein